METKEMKQETKHKAIRIFCFIMLIVFAVAFTAGIYTGIERQKILTNICVQNYHGTLEYVPNKNCGRDVCFEDNNSGWYCNSNSNNLRIKLDYLLEDNK
jgi:hypothetical protein